MTLQVSGMNRTEIILKESIVLFPRGHSISHSLPIEPEIRETTETEMGCRLKIAGLRSAVQFVVVYRLTWNLTFRTRSFEKENGPNQDPSERQVPCY